MLLKLRQTYANLVTSGAQVVLAGLALSSDTPMGMLAGSGLLAGMSLLTWTSALRRQRAIDDTATSRIASAAQGYVELVGRGKPLDGLPLVSPLTGLPCLWYRYRIERRQDNKWVRDEAGESDASFIIDDGSDQCVVDPEGAEIHVQRRDTWIRGDRRYSQWLLIERDTIYAIGEFVTKGSLDLPLDRDADVKARLADWKQDPKRLLDRFDLDRNGQLDLREWELARQQARREVTGMHRELRAQADVSVMRLPADGQLYLISNLAPEKLARRYRFWSWVHLAFFFFGLAALAYGWRAASN
jgi:hypothetical protein